MYSLLIGQDASQRLARETPALGASLILAELFYKFGSFSLECLAFLGTWFVLSTGLHALFPVRSGHRATENVESGLGR
jgi:hypothetical protein